MTIDVIKNYIGGRSCAILGLGVSNLPLATLLCREGIRLFIYDKHTAAELGEDALALQRAGAIFRVCDKDFIGIEGELIFRSPGIRPDVKGIAEAVAGGAELTSEAELFLKLTPAVTYAVTGSDGKTTSTTLTGKFLTALCEREGLGHTFVGGNIGTPLLHRCGEMSECDNAVLELSSFQLMHVSDAPARVAITNVSPNHLDWHTDMEEYIRAKKNIIGERTERLVTNADCPETLSIALECGKREGLEIALFSSSKHSFGEIFGNLTPVGKALAIYENGGFICVCDGKREEKMLSLCHIMLPGKHNVENYMTAIGLTYGDVPPEIYTETARVFFGVEHRLELVRTLDGVRWYNSSIDSSPTRTAAALSALAGESIVLICGGYDKKIPYAPLARAICEHGGVHTVVLTGATGEKIMAEIEKYVARSEKPIDVKMIYESDFCAAVHQARESARKGDCALLSPASASFDAFKNFAQRGNVFKEIVNSWDVEIEDQER